MSATNLCVSVPLRGQELVTAVGVYTVAIVCDSCGTVHRTGRGTERTARLLVWTQGWTQTAAGSDLCPGCGGEA